MNDLNRCIFTGRLVRDPEIRTFDGKDGTTKASLTIAVNRTYKDAQGNKKEAVAFLPIESWGNQAKWVGQYLKKGMGISVEARAITDEWQDKETKENRSKTLFRADIINFLPGNKRSDAAGEAEPNVPPAPAAPEEAPF